MPRLKIVTINILTDLSRWVQRRKLLLQGLAALSPDLIALQEVKLPQNPAKWLAEELSYPYRLLSPKMGYSASREALAIISRYPIEGSSILDLGGQDRIAQSVFLQLGEQTIYIANSHLYWQPGESAARLRQVERLQDWLHDIPGDPPGIVCGDFNGTPETQAIQFMRSRFLSAYTAIHGTEPEYTCPTPLPRSFWSVTRTFLGFFFLIRPQHINLKWRGTLDYIFVDPRLEVIQCQVVLDQPSQKNPRIYPSDHFGLYAEIEIPSKIPIV
jgi:endonuclease/exonuclease/phosphatase family metal-dependent hydrolase